MDRVQPNLEQQVDPQPLNLVDLDVQPRTNPQNQSRSILLNFSQFYKTVPNFTHFFSTLPNFTQFYLTLPNFTKLPHLVAHSTLPQTIFLSFVNE